MHHKINRLALAVHLGLAAGLLSVAGMAQAQSTAQNQTQNDQQPEKLKAVVVTGSLLRRVDRETASPVITIDRESIVNSGKPTLGDVLQQLPSISGNATNTHNNSNGGGVASPTTEGGDGASRVSLRGLGEGRTLVLINGQRMLNADINLIPANMIQRVEVLAEGASTTYGSDAIGGVVNFILRDHFHGFEASVNDGISGHGDGQRYGANITAGTGNDAYNIVGGLNYNHYSQTRSTRRDFASPRLYLTNGVPVPSGSSSIPTGRIQLPPALAGKFNCPNVTLQSGDGSKLSNYRCFQPNADAFNYAAFNYIQTAQKRIDAFVLGNVDLGGGVTAYLDAFYNHTQSAGLDAAAPVGTGDGLIIRASNPINPFGVTFSSTPLPGDPNSGYNFQTRLTGAGTRRHPYTTSTIQVIGGLRGRFGQSSWRWNLALDYGHTARTQNDHNELIIPQLQKAINSGANIFDQAHNGEALGAGAMNAKYSKYEVLRQAQFTADGEVGTINGRPVQLSLGALYREQSMNYTIDPLAVLDPTVGTCGILQEGCGSPGRGSKTVKEAFGEVLFPLLADLPGIHSLNLDIGIRTSKFSEGAGSTTNGKIAIEWRPVSDLLVRGTVSQVFRAPNLDMLYDGRSLVQPNLNDPCTGLTAAQLAQHPAACQYVPVNWAGNNVLQVNTYYSGSKVVNSNLKPEHGKSVDLGMVYNPHWLPGFNTSVDFWHIYLNDTLTALSAPTAVNACFNNNASPYCAFIHRRDNTTKQPGQVFYIDTPVVNLGHLSTSGVDFTVHYDLPDTGIGHLKFGLNTSYTSHFENTAIPGGKTIEYAGTLNTQFGNISRFRGTFTFNWQMGNWDAQWQTRYISPTTVLNADYQTNADLPIASVMYHSIQLGYMIPAIHTRLDIGVDNLSDRRPPLIYQNGEANTDPATYDVMGRYYWARATFRF